MPLFHLGPLHYTEKRRTLNCNYGISIVGVLLTSHRIRQMFDLPFSCVQEAAHIDRLPKHWRVDSFSQAFDEHVTRFRCLLLCNCVWQNAKTVFLSFLLSPIQTSPSSCGTCALECPWTYYAKNNNNLPPSPAISTTAKHTRNYQYLIKCTSNAHAHRNTRVFDTFSGLLLPSSSHRCRRFRIHVRGISTTRC